MGRARFFPRYDAPDPPSACFFFVVSGLSLGLESAELAARRKPAGPVLFRVWVFPPSDAFPSLFPSRGAVPIGFGLWCSVRVAWRGVATAAAALRVSHAPVVFRAGPGGLPLTDTCLPQGDLPLPGPCGRGPLLCIHQPHPSLSLLLFSPISWRRGVLGPAARLRLYFSRGFLLLLARDVFVVPCRLRLGLCSLDILFCLGLRSACGEADDGIVASQHSMLTAGFCRWLAGSHSRPDR